MDIDTRLAAIEKTQNKILTLLVQKEPTVPKNMTLKEAAEYVGFSSDHFRRLAVEQRMIPFSRPSGQQKGKLLFRRSDLDHFLDTTMKGEKTPNQPGRKRKSKDIHLW
jgi:excisionase family DNA binding protein